MKYVYLILLFMTTTSFADIDFNTCPPTNPNFRQCFEQEVYQSCMQHGGNSFICRHMHLVYIAMGLRYHNQVNACRANNHTEKDVGFCLEDWSCYLHGHYYHSQQRCPTFDHG